jgi:hypothetical protein
MVRNDEKRAVQLGHSLAEEVHVGLEQTLFVLEQHALVGHLVGQPVHHVGEQRHLNVDPQRQVRRERAPCVRYLLKKLGALVSSYGGAGGAKHLVLIFPGL